MVRLKCEEVYNDIKSVVEWLFDIISIERSSEYLSFIEKPYIPIVIEEQQEDISIEIETIHRAKGQTHCATLYVETLYEGKYESTHVLNRVSKKLQKKVQLSIVPIHFIGKLVFLRLLRMLKVQ